MSCGMHGWGSGGSSSSSCCHVWHVTAASAKPRMRATGPNGTCSSRKERAWFWRLICCILAGYLHGAKQALQL
jgi:hypothetical protein